MMGKRRYAGLARAAVTVALAIALLGPGPFVSPSPGGDDGSRSSPTPPDLLMVNVNETTCLAPSAIGGVFAGTDGGGIARWTEGGALVTLHTTADGGIATNHIVDMAPGVGTCLAIGDTEEPLVYATGAIGDRWFTLGEVDGAEGPLRALEGSGEAFLVLDARGAVFLSSTGASWSPLDPKHGLGSTGWWFADRDGDILAVSNGTDVVLVDLKSINHWTRPSPTVVDIDLAGDRLAIASPDHPDVYDLVTDSWLDGNLTQAIMDVGQGWSLVRMGGERFTAATLEGLVIEVNVTIPSSEGVKLQGTLSDEVDADVTDMLMLANDTVLLSTLKGNWVVDSGEARPFLSSDLSMPPSNDIRSVNFQADTLWVLTPGGLSSLEFDSQGIPTLWTGGPDLGEDAEMGTLDVVYLEGIVYICGYGPGIHTYDTFTSSAPSRWDRAHIYGDARDDVTDVAVVNGTLFTGGTYGVDRMVPGSDPPAFDMVSGSPAGVTCLYPSDGQLYVGTGQGLWLYDAEHSFWVEPGSLFPGLPRGPVGDVLLKGFEYHVAMEDRVHMDSAPYGDHPTNLTLEDRVSRLANRPDLDDPVWGVAGGNAFTMVWVEIQGPGGTTPVPSAREHGRDGMGDAWVHDISMAPDGTLYLATDSGLHRIDRYGTTWSEWTTASGLSANDIRALSHIDQARTLWVGAYGGVDVMDLRDETFTRVGVEDGIPSNLVYDIEMEGADVWLGTDVGGAARANRGAMKWQAYNTSTGLIADDVQAVAVWEDYALFGTDEGVTVLDRGESTMESYTSTSSSLPGNWVWCALSHPTGIYVGTDRGLARFDPSTGDWDGYDIEGIAGKDVRSLEMTRAGSLWVGTNDGLYVLPKDANGTPSEHGEKHLGRSGGLPGDEVLALREASDGMMWVGTSAGAAIVSGAGGAPGTGLGVQATFSTRDGLVHDRVTAIEEGPEGTMWLGTAGGLSRLEKDDYWLQPQWTMTSVDLPDVYVSLADVVVEPEEPNEGDPVNVTVTVSNPSGKRAIVHVGLFGDDSGGPGTEVDTDIAYTEPGSSYTVTLAWTAVGGEQNLWVVADPADVVPESNERNNLVALSIHVNRLPRVVDLIVSEPEGTGAYHEQAVWVAMSFTFLDEDGDRPICATAGIVGSGQVEALTVEDGDPTVGVGVMGGIHAPLGDSVVAITLDDGGGPVVVLFQVKANFGFLVEGLEKGRYGDGTVRFTVAPVDPWEGETIETVEVWVVEPGTDPSDPGAWSDDHFGSATEADGGWTLDASLLDPGKYDVWVLATDDRKIMALHVEEDVIIHGVEEDLEVPSYIWVFGAFIIICLVMVILVTLRGRSRT